MNAGIFEELNGNYLAAIQCYEKEISAYLDDNQSSYANLSFIYWYVAFEPSALDLPKDTLNALSQTGIIRYGIILEKGLSKYPNSLELNFWKLYFSHIGYGNDFTPEECEALLDRFGHNESEVPYFFLQSFDKNKYKKHITKLLNECNAEPTIKNIYIKSIIF